MIVVVGALGIGLLESTSGFPGLAFAAEHSGGFLETATGILYEGSGNRPLMYGAIVGFAAASVIALRRGLPLGEILRAAINSLRAMFIAVLILYLAWMVGAVCEDLGTAEYLSATISDAIPYMVLPLILFLLAGVIAFDRFVLGDHDHPPAAGQPGQLRHRLREADADPRARVDADGHLHRRGPRGDLRRPLLLDLDTTVSSIACA